jgi:uncharacterized membrane protein
MAAIVITFALLGALLGLGGGAWVGLVGGALIGYLLSRLSEVQRALEKVQATLETQRRVAQHESSAPVPQPVPAAAPPVREPAVEPGPASTFLRPEPVPPMPPARPAAPDVAPAAPRSASRRPDPLDMAWRAARRWLTTGNVPVKVGVVVSFFGIAFLLKYAVDRNLFVLPLELRLLGIAAVGVVLLALGWRLRRRNAVYALSLQGGGIGILYLTIFAAFRLYLLLPATAAFALLVVLMIAAGVLAVVQNAAALAALGSVGGFLAPVLVSTGQGSHVALFSYYLVLNAAILGISWFRAWQALNLVGFAFTFGVGTLWGYEFYRPELYASTQPFLVLNFLFYQLIAVLFAFRRAPKLRGIVDGTIVFGTPVIAFALQAALVEDTEYGLALSAAFVAAFYAGLAAWLHQRRRPELRLLVESYAALAAAFATITIPLAFDARWTAAAWALEGAALVWVGVRQHGILARLSGVGLLFAGGFALLDAGWRPDAGIAVLNGNVLGGLMVSFASLFSAHRLHVDGQPHPGQRDMAVGVLVWGLLWWLGTGIFEIDDRVPERQHLHAGALFFAASAVACAWLARRLSWPALRHATLAYLPVLLLPLGIWCLLENGHFLQGFGWIGWPAALATHWVVLRLYEREATTLGSAWHAAGVLLLGAGLAGEAYWRVEEAGFAGTWAEAAAFLALLLPAGAVVLWRDRLDWPLRSYRNAYLNAALALVAVQLLLLFAAGIDHPATPRPLPYVPVLNPFDLLTLAALALALRLIGLREGVGAFEADAWTHGAVAWAGTAFLLTTVGVVRGVHHLAGVPWFAGTLLDSVSVQAALSIYWGALAVTAMVLGARRTRRKLWLVGTALMAVVVAKLFLVDLGNTGTLARIVSFLGVGALLLLVGWFAPAPPRRAEAPE